MDEAEVKELERHLRALHRSFREGLPPVPGVSRSAVRVLGVVARARAVQPRAIADELGMVSSNVAAALRELEAAGYVERRRSETDGRRIAVTLTTHGVDAVATHRSLRADGLREAIETSLSESEQDQLAAAVPLLTKLVAARQRDRSS
jgi:DNA-binding MarR family transcriptional regulator